jgi:hypothetical protein
MYNYLTLQNRTKVKNKYGTRIKTIPKHVLLVPDKYRSIFVGNKTAGKDTAIDREIRRLPALNENTGLYDMIVVAFCGIFILL